MVSGQNGDIFLYDNKSFHKIADNPHHLPILQLLNKSNELLVLGFDRLISQFEIISGTHYTELLGSITTLSSQVTSACATKDTLFFIQDKSSNQKLLRWAPSELGNLQVSDFSSPSITKRGSTITHFKISDYIDGLCVIVYNSHKIVVYQANTKEIITKYNFKKK